MPGGGATLGSVTTQEARSRTRLKSPLGRSCMRKTSTLPDAKLFATTVRANPLSGPLLLGE